jgi:hypothetical protein
MPLSDRDYIRGKHPPNCSCVDCVNKRLGIVTQKTRKHYHTNNQKNHSSTPKYTLNKQTGKKASGCARFISCSIIVIIILLIVGVIGGGIFEITKYHGNLGEGITNAYHWVADGVVSLKDNIVDWGSSLTINSPNTSIPIVTSTSTPISTSFLGKATEAIKEFVSPSTDIDDYVARFNEYRQSKGLASLLFTEDLNKVAALRLKEIQMSFSHNSQGNYNRHLAENIVMGIYSNQGALECWQVSPGHNANMLDTSYRNTGYAIGGGYAVQVFTSYETLNGEPVLPPGWHWND